MILEAKNLTYGYDAQRHAIENLSIGFAEGKTTAVLGANGAGKSTLFLHLNGILQPEAGEVLFRGEPISYTKEGLRKLRTKVGIVFQNPDDQLFSASVYQDISFGAVNMGLPKEEVQRRVEAVMERIGITDLRERPTHSLSFGQKKRVAFAGIMVMEPEVLILDEPTAGLDVEARNEILDLLRSYAAEDESRTILITSHISSDLEHLCDDIYLIHEGKQILHEETDVILEQYGLIKASEEQYAALDKEYLLKCRKEAYGYACFTSDQQYYKENYPDLVVERAGIDELILMMTGGEVR